MSVPLLKTKFYVPPVRAELVPRPRLIERLNAGLCRKLTLVSAPAGFGKTTLLSEWASGRERSTAWLSLDESDNDPVRFWTYFAAALRTVDALVAEGVPSAFQAPQPPALEAILTALINEISLVAEHFVLVLDDYHLITAPAIHDGLSFLLDHLPPNLRLLISTRADPPLPLARLRGRGQLSELRQADLRFTHDEGATFLNACAGLNLSPKDVAALEARTEGWIAGLQMAAVSMQGQEDAEGFIRAFTGSDRYILDYLVEEVLQRQPKPIQTFLLQTSILDRLTSPLCDAVLRTGEPASQRTADPLLPSIAEPQAILEYLERNNLFVVPLDSERRWYRYHHLFADLLRYRLKQAQPDLVPILHGRAGSWYEQNGLIAEAIDHALAAGDPGWAAHLVEQAAEATMLRSEWATLLGWMDALPQDLMRASPRLCVYQALALVLGGQPLDVAQSRLQEAVEADTDGAIAGEVAAFRALIAAYRGERERSTELSQQALALLPEDSLFFRSFVAGFLGLAYLYVGDVETATQAFKEAVRVSEKTGNLNISVLARHHLAELATLQGRVDEAEMFYQQALAIAVDDRGRQQPIAGIALIGLGRMKSELYDLETAARYLGEGIELVEKWGEAGAITGYTGLARVRQAQGDVRGTLEAMEAAQRLAERFDAMEMDDLAVALYRAHLRIARGDLEPAARWLEGRGLAKDLSPGMLYEEIRTTSSLYRFREYTIMAWLRIAQGRPADALSLLRTLRRTAEEASWVVYGIDVLTLEALAYQARGDTDQALVTLEQALSLAEPGGFVHLFVEKGAPMSRLLRQAASHGIAPVYTGKLLAFFDAAAPGHVGGTAPSPLSQPLIEPLTERELQVLRLLPTHLSSTEIADELLVSVHTVRFHIKNIYGKLGVHSRADAVRRAKELTLL